MHRTAIISSQVGDSSRSLYGIGRSKVGIDRQNHNGVKISRIGINRNNLAPTSIRVRRRNSAQWNSRVSYSNILQVSNGPHGLSRDRRQHMVTTASQTLMSNKQPWGHGKINRPPIPHTNHSLTIHSNHQVQCKEQDYLSTMTRLRMPNPHPASHNRLRSPTPGLACPASPTSIQQRQSSKSTPSLPSATRWSARLAPLSS